MTLVGLCAALWIDALAGGGVVAGAPAVVVVAIASLLAGLRGAWLPLAAVGLTSAVLLSVADQVAEPGKFGLASDGVFYCVVVLGPSLIGWLIAGRSRQVAQLRARRHTLERQRAVAVRVARALERERVVRRLDVGLAERLVRLVAQVRTSGMVAETDPDGVPARLEEVENSARGALAELRDVLGTLRSNHSAESQEPAAMHGTGGLGTAAPGTGVPVAGTAQPGQRAVPALASRRIDLIDAALFAATVPLAIETALPGHLGPAGWNVLAALTQGGALLLLRRRPLIGLVCLLAVAALQTSVLAPLPPTVGWLLPALAAALMLGLTHPRSIALVGLVLLVAGDLAIELATPAGHRALAGLLPGLAMGLLVWFGGRLAAAAQCRGRELRAITTELDRRQADEVGLAVLNQRAEIARDLHDAGAHALTVVCLQAAAARAWWHRDPIQARLALDALTDVAQNTLGHVGQSLGAPACAGVDHSLDPRGLNALVEMGRALGLEVDLGVTGAPRPVPDKVGLVAYRVVQEGLTNAARHAAGSTVRIALSYRRDALDVCVLDSGRSRTAVVTLTGTGAGLTGMRERVEAIRGELHAGPRGPGFEISARLPT